MIQNKIKNIKYIDVLLEQGWPASEFALINSAWLPVAGIRENGDLDVIITSKLRKKLFNGQGVDKAIGIAGPYEKRVRIHPHNSDYGTFYNCKDVDDLIYNYTINIDKIKFVELRFYLMYKKTRLQKFMYVKEKRNLMLKLLCFLSSDNRYLQKKINRDVNDLIFFEKLFVSGNSFFSDNFAALSLDYPSMLWKLD